MAIDRSAPLAAVIPVFNRLSHTIECLDSLRAADAPAIRAIVIDDGSTDGTGEHLREHYPDVTVLEGDGNLWWTGATELGCRHAVAEGAEILLTLNNDNVVSPNLPAVMTRLVGETGGCVSAVSVEELSDGRLEVYQAGGAIDWRNGGARMHQGGRFESATGLESAEWLPGAAVGMPTAVYEEVGGFDLRFPQYRGDIDFTMRVRRAGHPLLVTYECWVVQDTGNRALKLDTGERVAIREYLQGFVSLRSSYNVREAIPFALRYCPPRMLPRYLATYYAKYTYSVWKTRPGPVLRMLQRALGLPISAN